MSRTANGRDLERGLDGVSLGLPFEFLLLFLIADGVIRKNNTARGINSGTTGRTGRI